MTVNHKNTLEVSKEYDFFLVLLNLSCLGDVCTKTAKMPTKSDVACMGVSATPPLECPTPTTAALDSKKQQICQQDKSIDNL